MTGLLGWEVAMSLADAPERFMAKIQVDDNGCWLWTAAKDRYGYGSFTVGGIQYGAHRWSYQHHVGPIPEGLHIDHTCKVTACVNPEHLEPVTQMENNRRARTGIHNAAGLCANGLHPWPESAMKRPGHAPRCRPCRKAADKVWYAKKKAGLVGTKDGEPNAGL